MLLEQTYIVFNPNLKEAIINCRCKCRNYCLIVQIVLSLFPYNFGEVNPFKFMQNIKTYAYESL